MTAEGKEGRLLRAFRISTKRDIVKDADGDFPLDMKREAVKDLARDQRAKRAKKAQKQK